MIFRRKTNTRHAGRTEVLEVRMRTRPMRAVRRRAVWWALLAATAVLATLYAGGRGWQWVRTHWIYDNEAFALNTIEVHTQGWVTPDQVRQWAGVRLGDNLLGLDLRRIQRDLEVVPQIESVSIESVLPHLLRLAVVERVPVAQVQGLIRDGQGQLAPAVFYLDHRAVVIPPRVKPPAEPALARRLELLPVFRGLSPAELQSGQPIGAPGVRAALRLLEAVAGSALARQVEIQSVDVSSPQVLHVTTRPGAAITFGLDNPVQAVRRWYLVRAEGQRLGREVMSLDLSLSNNCPVLWLEARTPPLLDVKPVKPSPDPNKNV